MNDKTQFYLLSEAKSLSLSFSLAISITITITITCIASAYAVAYAFAYAFVNLDSLQKVKKTTHRHKKPLQDFGVYLCCP